MIKVNDKYHCFLKLIINSCVKKLWSKNFG